MSPQFYMEIYMRKVSLIVLSSVLFFAQQVFADTSEVMKSSEGKACGVIAKTCMSAGYNRDKSANKRFWQDCMKPLLYGETVAGVTVDSATLKACRTAKINKLQKELKALQNAMQKN